VKFPTGGEAAEEPTSPRAKAELVRIQRRRYSPDGRSAIQLY